MYNASQFGVAAAAFFNLTSQFDAFIKASEVAYKLVEINEAEDKVLVAKLLQEVAGFTSLDDKNMTYFVEKVLYHAKKFHGLEK
jgi:hypothetical protein